MSDKRRGDVLQTPCPSGLRANYPRSALIGLAIATAITRASRLDRERLVQQRGSRGILR
ncbi:MAG TPA: hypothetical protein VLN56_04715 [Gammaproteobacteria bacterium]|nr:hypothetical protein [Gammaproteobacteria bacterium]